jgi:hypothetical protein
MKITRNECFPKINKKNINFLTLMIFKHAVPIFLYLFTHFTVSISPWNRVKTKNLFSVFVN